MHYLTINNVTLGIIGCLFESRFTSLTCLTTISLSFNTIIDAIKFTTILSISIVNQVIVYFTLSTFIFIIVVLTDRLTSEILISRYTLVSIRGKDETFVTILTISICCVVQTVRYPTVYSILQTGLSTSLTSFTSKALEFRIVFVQVFKRLCSNILNSITT